MNEELNSLLREVRADIGDDFIATHVVGLDGISIAGEAARDGFNAELATAYFAMIMKLAERVSSTLKLGKVLENQLSTEEFTSVVRPLGNGGFHWLLIAREQSILGLLRAEMDQYEQRIWGAIST